MDTLRVRVLWGLVKFGLESRMGFYVFSKEIGGEDQGVVERYIATRESLWCR